MTARRRLRLPLLVAGFVGLHAGLVGRGPSVPAPPSPGLRVVSWNLRNFPGEPGEHDLSRLRQRLDELDPQVLALQEILDPRALPPLRPGWRWHVSVNGGRHGPQHLVIGWDPAVVDVLEPREHTSLTMGGKVRPALSGYVRSRHGGPDFHLVVVHLKATRDGHALRQQQWSRLVDAIAARHAAGPVDADVLLVGDFNAAGGPRVTPTEERTALAAALRPARLTPWILMGGCTAYWDGPRRDSWWEPSQIDLVWSEDLHEVPNHRRRAWPGTHCARHRCAPIEASDDYPEPDLHHISDHCPVVVDLPGPDDDP